MVETAQQYATDAFEKSKQGIATVQSAVSEIEADEWKKQAMEKIELLKAEAEPKLQAMKEIISEQTAVWLPKLQELLKSAHESLLALRKTLHVTAEEKLKPILEDNKVELNVTLLVDVICASILVLVVLSMRDSIITLVRFLLWNVLSMPARVSYWLVSKLLFYTFCCCCCQSRKAKEKKAAQKKKEEGLAPKTVFLQFDNKKTEMTIRPRTTTEDIKKRLKCKHGIRILKGGKVITFNKIPGGGERVGRTNYEDIAVNKKIIWTVHKK
jgi:hypothetical protein